MRCLIFFLVPLTLACSTEGDSTEDDACPTESLATTAGLACSARLDVPSSGSCTGTDAGDEPKPVDRDAAACVLTALRDRTFGIVTVDRSPDAFGFCGSSDEIHIVGDEAWVTHSDYYDMNRPEESFPVNLKPAAFYQACLDGTDAELTACFSDLWTSGSGCPGQCCESD
jgi:hypothetical protein